MEAEHLLGASYLSGRGRESSPLASTEDVSCGNHRAMSIEEVCCVKKRVESREIGCCRLCCGQMDGASTLKSR